MKLSSILDHSYNAGATPEEERLKAVRVAPAQECRKLLESRVRKHSLVVAWFGTDTSRNTGSAPRVKIGLMRLRRIIAAIWALGFLSRRHVWAQPVLVD